MHIFGITGPIGHGKTTLANALMKLEQPAIHMESSMIISEVANEWLATFPKELLLDPIDYDLLNDWIDQLAQVISHQIKPVDAKAMYISHDMLKNEGKYVFKLFMYLNLIRQGVVPLGEPITEENKDRHRPLLQWLGGYMVERVDQGLWYDEIERRIQKAETDGVRMYVVGGVRYPYDAEVIRRNGGRIIKLVRQGLPERELDDITEAHRQEIHVDTTIISDAKPEALEELVQNFYHDLLLGDVLKEYNSNDYAPLVE